MVEPIHVILAGLPGVLTAIAAVWISLRRRRVEDKQAEHEMTADEEASVIKGFQRLMEERRKAHERDMDRVDRQLGQVLRELDHCRKGHRRSENLNARLIAIMRTRDLITETQEQQMLREAAIEDEDSEWGEGEGDGK